jgi:hypothetical protein
MTKTKEVATKEIKHQAKNLKKIISRIRQIANSPIVENNIEELEEIRSQLIKEYSFTETPEMFTCYEDITRMMRYSYLCKQGEINDKMNYYRVENSKNMTKLESALKKENDHLNSFIEDIKERIRHQNELNWWRNRWPKESKHYAENFADDLDGSKSIQNSCLRIVR